jgi:DNA-binding NtrC family response regulator
MSSHPMTNTESPVKLAELPEPQCEFERDLERFLRHLQSAQPVGSEPTAEEGSLRHWLDLAESWKIAQTLRACRGNRSAAARQLGIGRRTLYAKMEKLGITPTWL